jgi:diaminohydroxyphosphoribosylaminopyrimidine deaminase / 5-amino-6-(5-phosphoribosylamino)uracil reductase
VTPSPDAAAEAHASDRAGEDERFMRLALALGRRHLGATWPNPSVGALLVRCDGDGPRIIAQGVTRPGGRPHAEAVALEAAGLGAAGATLYVTLEPCSHRTIRGGTPCVEDTIRAGVRRVVSAVEDPNPNIAGLGHALLRSMGVAVSVGTFALDAARDHRGHMTRVTKGRPAVTLKLAQTADGFAALRQGPRLMITGEETQARVHLMRAHADAILVGVGTVLADDPILTVRLPGLEGRSPVRVVFDGELRTPPRSRIAATAREQPTWIITGVSAPLGAEEELLEIGVEVMRVGHDAEGRLDVEAGLRLLALRGITRVFCEGGPVLADALAAGEFIDEVILATGPMRWGGAGVPAVGQRLGRLLRESFCRVATELSGADMLETFERIESCSPVS